MKTIAVIPARGGSKGIPRKNVRLLAGKPLVAHAIECCLETKTVNRVVVSTDDAEIEAVAERYGAEVVRRPQEISGDAVPSEAAVLHALQMLTDEHLIPDIVLLVQCTSPLTLPEDVDGTVNALLAENADSALAVTPFHGFLWRPDQQAGAVGINHDRSVRLRRQELPPQYLETGAVYAMRTKGFLKAQHRFFGKVALYIMPKERCLEIDEPHDLVLAEILIRESQRKRRARLLPWPVEALVLDFDGVLTDNRVVVDETGREAVICSRGDGWGLGQLKALELPILVLSAEENPVVQARCQKLGICCIQGSKNKLRDLTAWTTKRGLNMARVVYVGNDVDDLPCLEAVGCGIVVNNAHPNVRLSAKIVLDSPGGHGAIRELADMLVTHLKKEK